MGDRTKVARGDRTKVASGGGRHQTGDGARVGRASDQRGPHQGEWALRLDVRWEGRREWEPAGRIVATNALAGASEVRLK